MDNRNDMLCRLSFEELNAKRPYSNISEYCLRDNASLTVYLSAKGVRADLDSCSDYELLSTFLKCAEQDGEAFVVNRIRGAIDSVCGGGTRGMSAEELWQASTEALARKSADELWNINADRLGIPRLPEDKVKSLPTKIGKTYLSAVSCPFGTTCFDIELASKGCRYEEIESLAFGDSVAIFANGFEFEEPNEYVAGKAHEKLVGRKTLSDRERRVLGSQLCRRIMLAASKNEAPIMILLPTAPDVHSMGEISRMLDYLDEVPRAGRLDITLFGADAVGLCFAQAVASRGYKKITAATGICGSGCGCAGAEDAEYWGADSLHLKKASLSTTPAFIGQ